MSRRRKRLPQEPVTASVERLTHDGRGIAIIDGKTTFIDGALPGETVSFQYTRKRGQLDEGQLVEVITPSPERQAAACPHFGVCGGCSQQHIPSETQLALKQTMLLEQFKHFGGITPAEILPPLTGPEYGYRHKARLGVRYVEKKGLALVGFCEKNGRYVADMHSCQVLAAPMGALIQPLRELITKLAARSELPQIEVAIDDEQCALVFRHLSPLSTEDREHLREFGITHKLMLFLQPAGPDSIHLFYNPTDSEELHYSLPAFNLQFCFDPNVFTQINPAINRQLVSRAIDLLELQTDDTVLDLFCGLGNFTLPLARRAQYVVGIEGSDALVELAKRNASHNDINNVEYHSADLTQDMSGTDWGQRQYTKCLIDPPRSGAEEILPLIAGLNIPRLAYVSCNPATLARDAGVLVNQHGYQLQQAGIINMFPHTKHVESIAVFGLK